MIWLLLAAGVSKRFGSSKQLARFGDGRLIDAAINALQATGHPLLTVMSSTNTELAEWLSKRELRTIEIESSGMGDSIASGVRAVVDAHQPAWLGIALADMPGLNPSALQALLNSASSEQIVRPVHPETGQPGHPVIFGSAFFEELMQCKGDEGAASVIRSHRDRVVDLPVADSGCFADIDTPDQLAAWISASRKA